MKKIFLFSIFVFLTFGFFSLRALAASRYEGIIDWKAETIVSDRYIGRALPVAGSPISIAFNLMEGGKPLDFSESIVRWYVNGRLYRNEDNGLGISQISTRAIAKGGNTMTIRVVIPDFQGEMIDKLINIPIASPKAVIDAAFNVSAAGRGDLLFVARPFFFSSDNLVFSWNVDGEEVADLNTDNDILNLNLPAAVPSGRVITITLSVSNYLTSSENASKTLKIITQ